VERFTGKDNGARFGKSPRKGKGVGRTESVVRLPLANEDLVGKKICGLLPVLQPFRKTPNRGRVGLGKVQMLERGVSRKELDTEGSRNPFKWPEDRKKKKFGEKKSCGRPFPSPKKDSVSRKVAPWGPKTRGGGGENPKRQNTAKKQWKKNLPWGEVMRRNIPFPREKKSAGGR